jgi:hypothetical protein
MSDNISAPPQEALDCLAALQNAADLRTQRRDASPLRTMLAALGVGNGASADAAAKITKDPQTSGPKLFSVLPQP